MIYYELFSYNSFNIYIFFFLLLFKKVFFVMIKKKLT